ncbi:hypothetical protein HJFPF1_07996 [Paramyrothecium foliicola]|nr:hypothetical protein HJFPF1_07996 [Paramyrothecium foliicola]
MARGNGVSDAGRIGGTSTMPTRFRCKIGLEWKPLDAFSNNQRRLVQNELDAGRRVDASRSGMVCREHSANMTQQIQCEKCDRFRDRKDFSKSSLRNEVYQCITCVAWVETQEAGVTPAPLPTGHVSAEEEGQDLWKDRATYSGELFGEDTLPQAPISALSALGLNDEDQEKIGPDFDINSVIRQAASVSTTASRGTSASELPPHLRSWSETTSIASDTDGSENMSTRSGAPGVQARGTTQLPPHLRGKLSSASSSVAGSPSVNYQSTGSTSTATTLRERGQDSDRAYNTWDPTGVRHRRAQTPSSSNSTSLIDFDGDDQSSTKSSPAGAAFTTVKPRRGTKNGWHKAPRLSSTELLEFGNVLPDKAQYIHAELDHQRRFNHNNPE